MSSNRSYSGWRSWRVGARLAIIPGLFIAALVANLGYAVNTLRGNEVDALLVQVSTRQEAAAEQYVKEVLLASQGFPSGHVETLARLVETAERLKSGGKVLIDEKTVRHTTLPAAPNATIAAMAGEQKQLSETLGKRGEALLATSRSSPAYAARLNELLAAGLQVDLNIHHGEELFEQTAESRVEGMIWMEVVIASIVTLAGIAVSTVLARGITRPLGQVVQVADEISQGNLRQSKIEVQSGDEIGDLASVFNSMLDNLRQLTGRNRTSAESVNAATAQILSFTQQQAAGAAEQAAAVQQPTATLEEIRQSGAQIADKARQVAASSEATSTTSQAGLHAIQQMARSMEGIREQAEAVAGNIVVLSEKTQAVGEIVATVNDIAEQSNLLALNAAIEAAAAGEHGRSFAVVASEMKNLAQQSREATVQVRSILGDIQKGINTSVMLTEEAVKRVETGRQQVDVAGQTIREMAESIIQSVQAFQQIVAATSQQQIGYEQVTQAVQNIRIAAEQAAAGTRQLESAAAGLTSLAQELRLSMESYQL